MTKQPALSTGLYSKHKFLTEFGFYEMTRSVLRRFHRTLDKPVPSTTLQTAALRTSVVGRPGERLGRDHALCEGIDLNTGEPVFTDPFSDYSMPDGPQSPTRVTIGDISMGKSAALKTLGVLRPLLLGRRVVVVDKKLQAGAGEYTPLCLALGVTPIRFTTDGFGVRINVLDPLIARTASGMQGAGQLQLLRAILAEALGRPVSPVEGKALHLAHTEAAAVAEREGRVPDIRDIVPALRNPSAAAAEANLTTVDQLRAWGQDLAFSLERMVQEDLAGLIDGPTDPRIQLDSSLTVFDISALPDDGPAVPIVMAIISSWLNYTLVRQGEDVIPTHFVVEEGWHLMKGSFGETARRNTKLARGTGLAADLAIHHLSDIPADSPAMSMVREAGTVRIFRQAHRTDAEAVIEAFNLDQNLINELCHLRKGTYFLWQTARPLRYVQGIRSDFEKEITNTDAVMLAESINALAGVYERDEIGEVAA